MDSWILDPAFHVTHGSLNGDECVAPSQAFAVRVVCHEVLSKWKILYQTWMQPWHKGGFFPFQKNRGIFPWLFATIRMCDGHPPRHTTSVGRMPNCCIFWKWAWRAGWKNLSFGFFSAKFFVEIPPKVVSICLFPQPNLFPYQKTPSLKP